MHLAWRLAVSRRRDAVALLERALTAALAGERRRAIRARRDDANSIAQRALRVVLARVAQIGAAFTATALTTPNAALTVRGALPVTDARIGASAVRIGERDAASVDAAAAAPRLAVLAARARIGCIRIERGR